MINCFSLNKIFLPLCLLLSFMLSGCNGIARYKTLGFRESGTCRLYNRLPGYMAPLTIPAGVVVDSGIAVADTAANPFCALYIVSHGPDGHLPSELTLWIFIPLWWVFTPVEMAALPFLEKNMYESVFGREGHWLQLQDSPGDISGIEDNKKPSI